MKTKSFLSLSVIFLVTFSILLTIIPDNSFALSAKRLKRDGKEMERIEKFEGTVKREGDTLLLKSSSGSYISLKNSPGCKNQDTCSSFIFVDYFRDAGFFLVKGYYWEEIEHIMISKSDGKQYNVHELPILSPDKRHFITVPDDTNTGYKENGIFIWRIDGTEIILEFSYEPTKIATYRSKRWKDNRFIELEKWILPSGGPCPENAFMIVDVELKLEADGWKMSEDFSPGSPKCVNGW